MHKFEQSSSYGGLHLQESAQNKCDLCNFQLNVSR